MEHLDLLFGARRLWKLRLDSCRLVDLENQILGVEREGDLPGEMIPYCYFEFLRTQAGASAGADLPPQRHRHSVAGLPDGDRAVRLPRARRTRRCGTAPISSAWRAGCSRPTATRRRCGCFRRAVELGLPDALLFRTLWDIAAMERRAGRVRRRAGGRSRNWPNRAIRIAARALEELAKHYEHRERNYAMALEMTLQRAGDRREPAGTPPRGAPAKRMTPQGLKLARLAQELRARERGLKCLDHLPALGR